VYLLFNYCGVVARTQKNKLPGLFKKKENNDKDSNKYHCRNIQYRGTHLSWPCAIL